MNKETTIKVLPRLEPAPVTLSELKLKIARSHLSQWFLRNQNPLSLLWTPLLRISHGPTSIYLKLESEQVTNSFKARGAVHRLHGTTKHVVTASTGNHALAVLHAASLTRIPVTIFLPTTAKQGKLEALRRAIRNNTHAKIEFSGTDCLEAERAAQQYAKSKNKVYLSPYNDLSLIAGQGTTGIEIHDSLSKLHPTGQKACYVTVGGGGLMAGIAAALKTRDPSWRIVGCQPYQSAAMYESIRAGRVIEIESGETLSDGSAGGIEEGCLTFDLCRHLVDAWALVTEEDIAQAMYETFHEHRKVIEGSAGVAVAGCRADAKWQQENNCVAAVAVVCGGNVDVETFAEIISKK